MKHKDLNGRVKYKNISRCRVDWDKSCRSKFQKTVKDFFASYWNHDIVYEEMPLVGTRLSLDLANYTKKIAVEVQGIQHTQFNKFFHVTRNSFRRQLNRDGTKEQWCTINGYRLICIFPDDLKKLSRNWIFEEFGIYL